MICELFIRMEKNNDCYFYYYSNCTKGDYCAYRHEPLALGTEEMCELWEYGRCLKRNCDKRHMIIQMKRTETLCYWETQPSGCQKPHCVFKHLKKKSLPSDIPLADPREPKSEDVPSPKLNPILINFSETDTEESPQKPIKSQPALTLSKARSAKMIYRSTSAAGLAPNPDAVKSKSIREIKREKILRAKIEQEKKLLALRKSENRGNAESTITVKFTRTTNTAPQDQNNDNDNAGVLESGKKRNHPQTDGPDLPNKQVIDISALPIKSFDEIMAEKRKRKQFLDNTKSQSGDGVESSPSKLSRLDSCATEVKSQPDTEKNTRSPATVIKPAAVIIPPRKMKIRSSNKTTQQTAKSISKFDMEPSVKSKVANDGEDSILNLHPDIKAKEPVAAIHIETEEATPVTPNDSKAIQHADDEELELLESGNIYGSEDNNSGGDNSVDVYLDDDEKLLNEMEELLA